MTLCPSFAPHLNSLRCLWLEQLPSSSQEGNAVQPLHQLTHLVVGNSIDSVLGASTLSQLLQVWGSMKRGENGAGGAAPTDEPHGRQQHGQHAGGVNNLPAASGVGKCGKC